jgi:hypothetical protein
MLKVQECAGVAITNRLWSVHIDVFDDNQQFIERYVVSASPVLTQPYNHIWCGTLEEYERVNRELGSVDVPVGVPPPRHARQG